MINEYHSFYLLDNLILLFKLTTILQFIILISLSVIIHILKMEFHYLFHYLTKLNSLNNAYDDSSRILINRLFYFSSFLIEENGRFLFYLYYYIIIDLLLFIDYFVVFVLIFY